MVKYKERLLSLGHPDIMCEVHGDVVEFWDEDNMVRLPKAKADEALGLLQPGCTIDCLWDVLRSLADPTNFDVSTEELLGMHQRREYVFWCPYCHEKAALVMVHIATTSFMVAAFKGNGSGGFEPIHWHKPLETNENVTYYCGACGKHVSNDAQHSVDALVKDHVSLR